MGAYLPTVELAPGSRGRAFYEHRTMPATAHAPPIGSVPPFSPRGTALDPKSGEEVPVGLGLAAGTGSAASRGEIAVATHTPCPSQQGAMQLACKRPERLLGGRTRYIVH
eukprot:5548192-Pleurochrysis_carterae.AAC.1